jgi:RES domain-containing protein
VRAWRFVSEHFPDPLSAEGARRHGGRWNSKGVAVLYCSTSVALAMLELRVHSPRPFPRTRLKFVMEVPDDAISEARGSDLLDGWDSLPPGPASKRLGDAWVAAGTSLALLVPSVIAREERNLVLNPSHERFDELRVVSKERVTLDSRLYTTQSGRRAAARKK